MMQLNTTQRKSKSTSVVCPVFFFFNRELFAFLYHIETQEAHPDNVHIAFKGFFGYLPF